MTVHIHVDKNMYAIYGLNPFTIGTVSVASGFDDMGTAFQAAYAHCIKRNWRIKIVQLTTPN